MSKPLDELLLETLGKPSPGPEVPMQNVYSGHDGTQFTRFGQFEKALIAYKQDEKSLFGVGRALVSLRQACREAQHINPTSPITQDLEQGLALAYKFARIATINLGASLLSGGTLRNGHPDYT